MIRWTRCAAVAFVLALAACGDTSSDSPLAPSRPDLDSGLLTGSNAQASSDTTTAAPIPERSGLLTGSN
jgi:hypothetical protein